MRRSYACVLFGLVLWVTGAGARAAPGLNLAPVATPGTSYVSGFETLAAINSDNDPRNERDNSGGAYGNWPHRSTEWVEYTWSKPIHTAEIGVYWWRDYQGVNLPVWSRLLYWDGAAWAPVKNAQGLGVKPNQYNVTRFDPVTTTRLRLEFGNQAKFSTGILQWKVFDAGDSPAFAPVVKAGEDGCAFVGRDIKLAGKVKPAFKAVQWSKLSGPGEVVFTRGDGLQTSARFDAVGDYVLQLAASSAVPGAGTLKIHVLDAPPRQPLEEIFPRPYKVDSKLWNSRLKALIVHWIPHCISKLSEPNLPEGGLENFIQAGNKLEGKPYQKHVGPPWSDAYTLNMVESMCDALLLQAPDDAEITAAQAKLRQTLDTWVPIILRAQEPDGYLQTRFTLGVPEDKVNPAPRWKYRGDHEGYVGGYFIDATIAHYLMTGGKDRRMYDAAKRLADCWVANIGPAPKRTWYDGHEEIEQALARLARFADQVDGPGTGDNYLRLAKFLLESRHGGAPYDQSQAPFDQQSEAVGHAVRAVYFYSGLAEVAMQTGDLDIHRAAASIWSNLVNKKYYVTGGVGSGETAEGFGANYSLPNNAYCESCSSCGEIYFQHKLNLIYGDSVYADLLEETLYNALLGSIDLTGDNFTYTNPLDSSQARYPWHTCPCCVGNIPRTLLMLPEFMYAKSADSLYVNLYIGGTFTVPNVAGADVEVVQKTDYPWSGAVSLTLNPAREERFSLRLRIPRHDASALYTNRPETPVPASIVVNGAAEPVKMEQGYAVITRTWRKGDTVGFDLPLAVQQVRCDPRVKADLGKVALRYGPLIYAIESADQNVDQPVKKDASFSTLWNPDLLDGVVTIHGEFADGSPLTAIPYFARNNRGGRALVWMKEN